MTRKANRQSKFEEIEERLAIAENLLRDFVSRISDVVPILISANTLSGESPHPLLAQCLSEVINHITAKDPDKNLTLSAQVPCAIFKRGFATGPITPLQRWLEIGRSLRLLPESIQVVGHEIGLGSKKLPSWHQIENLFSKAGFQAIPVVRAVGSTLFQYLISKRKFPVCTDWMMRYKRAPPFTIGDTFHEIGHGLAFAQDDYRKFSVRFAKSYMRTKCSEFNNLSFSQYLRCFENSFVVESKNKITPVGPVSIILDSLKYSRGRLHPRNFELKNIWNIKQSHLPYPSYSNWVEDAHRLVNLAQSHEIGSLSRKHLELESRP